MARREFPKAVKVAVIKRAGSTGIILCEACGSLAKRWQIDHIRPDGLLGEPTIENAQLLGECCYAPKNADDTRTIAQAKRHEAKHLGVKKQPSLRSRGFTPASRQPKRLDPSKRANGVPAFARRFGLEDSI